MYREIDANGIKLKLLANGATPYLYKNVFKKDLLLGMNINQRKVESKNADEAEEAGLNLIDIGVKVAYIMNAQAENKNLSKLNDSDFYKWLENFGAFSLYQDEVMSQVLEVLYDDMDNSSEAKNK